MIKHAVKHNFDSMSVSFFNKFPHLFVCSERRIDFKIIGSIILVLRGGFVYGCHVNSAYSQICKIFNFVDYALKISAEYIAVFYFAA